MTLLDAWAAYKITPEISVKVGQFKESWSHEKDISFTNQLAVDRTLVDTVIGGNLTDRVQGVSVTYGGTKNNPIRAEVALHDGANSKNTDFRDFVGTTANPANFGAGGRFEYKLFGDWANYRDFTAKGNKEDLLVVGGGLDWTQRGDLDTTIAGIDAQYETAWGLNAFAGIVGNFANTARATVPITVSSDRSATSSLRRGKSSAGTTCFCSTTTSRMTIPSMRSPSA